MKKEFKAPIVETKVLSTREDIMDSVIELAKSGNQGEKYGNVLEDANKGYNQWKGFNN